MCPLSCNTKNCWQVTVCDEICLDFLHGKTLKAQSCLCKPDLQVWQNCRIYNVDGSDIWNICQEAENAFDANWTSARLPLPSPPPLPPSLFPKRQAKSGSKRQRDTGQQLYMSTHFASGGASMSCFQSPRALSSSIYMYHLHNTLRCLCYIFVCNVYSTCLSVVLHCLHCEVCLLQVCWLCASLMPHLVH